VRNVKGPAPQSLFQLMSSGVNFKAYRTLVRASKWTLQDLQLGRSRHFSGFPNFVPRKRP
jgi:hypothetical protein